MCKIMTFTDLSKVKSIPKLVNSVTKALKSQKDGFGYAIQTDAGVFGERTIQPARFTYAFDRKELTEFTFLKRAQNKFGTRGKIASSGIFHGRTSTNHKSLVNTHPISKHGWHLIHNGVVSDHGPKYETITTNDTEHLLERLATGGIDAVSMHLSGYYAVSAIDDKGQLHIIRDDRAPLYFAQIMSIDSYVFATTQDSIEQVCKDMKWEHSLIDSLADNHYLVWQNNSLISQTEFKPRGATIVEDKYSYLSLREHASSYTSAVTEYEFCTKPVSIESTVVDATQYTEDEMLFLAEIEEMDTSYEFLDFRDNPISFYEFLRLEPAEQFQCTVIRPDGTVCDPTDFETETLYRGRAG